MTRAPLLALTVTATLLLAACGSSGGSSGTGDDNPVVTQSSTSSSPTTAPATASTSAAAASATDPCTLAAPADVEAAFGGTSGAGAAPTPKIRPECDWRVTASNLGSDGKVALFFPSVQSSAAFDAAKAGLPGIVAVPGTGDDAFYEGTLRALTVLVGERQFTVQALFGGADAATTQADLTALAKSVAAKY